MLRPHAGARLALFLEVIAVIHRVQHAAAPTVRLLTNLDYLSAVLFSVGLDEFF